MKLSDKGIKIRMQTREITRNRRTFESEILYLLSKSSKMNLRADLIICRTKSQQRMVDILLLVMRHFSNRFTSQILHKMPTVTVTRTLKLIIEMRTMEIKLYNRGDQQEIVEHQNVM